MNCPLCRDQALVPNYRAGIEIDVCPQCKGVWLDRGELDKLADAGPPAAPLQDTPVAANATSGKKSEKKSDKKTGAKSKKKKKKKSGFGDRLGDILEDVLDL